VLLHALGDLKAEVLACRTFTELVSGGALDRFRSLKRRLGETLLHPRLLPVLLETTVNIKNRFRMLWEDEETALLADTNKVRDLEKQLSGHPEMATPDLREMLEVFRLGAPALRRGEADREPEARGCAQTQDCA